MVKIRRPTPAHSSGGNKLATYGKYALIGGILVWLANFLSGTGSNVNDSGHAILRLKELPRRTSKPPRLPAHQIEREEDPEPVDRLSGDSKEDQEDESQENQQKIQYVSPNGEVLEKPQGTGPTKLGFVMDLVYERSHPTFRTGSIHDIEPALQRHAKIVATAFPVSDDNLHVQPCEYLEGNRLLQREQCRDPERQLLLYNSAPFHRSWCGISIPPNSVARMDHDKRCDRPVQLFQQDHPPIDGQGMPPIVVHSHPDGQVDESQLEEVQCTIPCRIEKRMTGIERFVQGTDWSIFQSDQDPMSRKEIQVELSKHKHDEYFSTAYFKSDVPLSRFDFSKHNLRNRPPINFDDTIDKAIYMVSEQCGATNSRRTRWLEVLEEKYHIDSVGKCKHTRDLQPGEALDTLEDRLEILKQYKFNLGFEVSTHKDWITELSYEAFLSGAVPIVLGASNANSHFPKEGAIYTSDFNNWDNFAAHVNQVATNRELWESYHAWRTDEAVLAAFERKYRFTKTGPDCRLCSWAYAKMYGLGWDHELQTIRDTHLPRKMCVQETSGLIALPFQEIWSVGPSSTLGPTGGAEGCNMQSDIKHNTVRKDDWSITRSVIQHDSITDITIHEININSQMDEAKLTFKFNDVNNTEAAFFQNSHTLVATERGMLVSSATIQDHKSKITILANWETDVWSPGQGQIQLLVQGKDGAQLNADEVRRIRLISEDMGQLHDKMTEYFPSSFSKRMIKDFVDPVEVFYMD